MLGFLVFCILHVYYSILEHYDVHANIDWTWREWSIWPAIVIGIWPSFAYFDFYWGPLSIMIEWGKGNRTFKLVLE